MIKFVTFDAKGNSISEPPTPDELDTMEAVYMVGGREMRIPATLVYPHPTGKPAKREVLRILGVNIDDLDKITEGVTEIKTKRKQGRTNAQDLKDGDEVDRDSILIDHARRIDQLETLVRLLIGD